MIPKCDDDACINHRIKLYIVYGIILMVCMSLAFCHFMIAFLKRRRVKEFARDYHMRRESFAALAAAAPFSQIEQFESVKDDFRITTDGATEMVIEIPEGHNPFPLLSNGLENGTNKGSTINHRPLEMDHLQIHGHDVENPLQLSPQEIGETVLSNKNMNTNIVRVEVHPNSRRSSTNSRGSSFDHRKKRSAGPKTLAVSTVSQSYNAIQTTTPVVVSDAVGGTTDHISRPQSSMSAYDISDIVHSSPEACNQNKAQKKKSPKTC